MTLPCRPIPIGIVKLSRDGLHVSDISRIRETNKIANLGRYYARTQGQPT
jgi:hypothetical protein